MKKTFISKIVAVIMVLCMVFTSGVTVIADTKVGPATAGATGNSLDNPTCLEFDKEYSLTVPDYEWYYYSFTLDKSSSLTLNISGALSNTSYMIYDYTEATHESEYIEYDNVNVVESNEYKKTATFKETIYLVAGQYCLAVSPKSYDEVTDFTLSITKELSEEMFPESTTVNNNSIENASAIDLDTKIIGQFAHNDTKDIYSFNVTEEAAYLFECSGGTYRHSVSVYNENLDKVPGEYGRYFMRASLMPGKYYFIIEEHSDFGEYWFLISKAPLLESCVIELEYDECEYDGNSKKPRVTIRKPLGGFLHEHFDFRTDYSDNVEAGTASVTITPTWDSEFAGTVTKTFKIHLPASKTVTANLYEFDDVKVSWNEVVGAEGYAVYYKKASASEYIKLQTTTGTSLKAANLADGVKYQFKIVPYITENDEIVESVNYKTVGIYTLKKLNKPTVVKNNKSTVKVKWNNINGETGYQISKSTKKTGTKVVATYKTTTGKYKNIKATKGKTYYYKVRAYKVENGKKVFGPWSSVTSYKLK